MSRIIPASELIINSDESVYHLNLKPGQIAHKIITVGDPERVKKVTQRFDSIELEVSRREFFTQTGHYQGQRLSVISTGIGTDNIDIVFNELDALVNVDFNTRKVKREFTQLEFIRIGTSGALQDYLALDSTLVSAKAIGLDALMHYYQYDSDPELMKIIPQYSDGLKTYTAEASTDLLERYGGGLEKGITLSAPGFYGPQGRAVRSKPKRTDYLDQLRQVEYLGLKCTNLEMETAGIYGLASLLGHKAISFNALLANRANETFSSTPSETVNQLIKNVLERVVEASPQ